MSALASHPKMTGVVLTEEDFRDNNLEELNKSQPNIQHVEFGMCNGGQWIVTDADLEKLKALPQVTSVDLSGCSAITRRGLEYLSLYPEQIKILILNDCPKITDTFFGDIVHFKKLEHLEVRGCFWITDNGIKALVAAKELRYLDISVNASENLMTSGTSSGRPNITDVSMLTLAKLSKLESLVMEGCSDVTDKGIVRLVPLRNLTSLNLSGTGLTNNGLMVLKYLPTLHTLQIADCRLSEKDTAQQLSAVPTLMYLDISRVPCVTDGLIQGLSQYLDLKHLNIAGCEQLSDNCMLDINKFSSLEHLNANNCPGISAKSLAHLTLSHLSSLHVNTALDIKHDHLSKLTALEFLEFKADIFEEDHLRKLIHGLKHLRDVIVHVSTAGVDRCMNMSGKRILVKHATSTHHHE